MSNREDEFLQRLRATFKVEADEHVQAMSSRLLALEKMPHAQRDAAAIEAVFRHAHSLKGAARATNSSEIESICQSLETVFAAWKRQAIELSPESFDILHRAIDLIGKLTLSIADPRPRENDQKITATIRQLAQLTSSEPPTAISAAAPVAAVPAARENTGDTPVAKPEPPASRTAAAPLRHALPDTIRISTAKLDRLMLDAEEMLIAKQSSAQRAADLRQLDPLFARWTERWTKLQPQLRALRAETASTAAHNALVDFLDWNFTYLKSLEAKIRPLVRSAAQDRHEIAKRVDDLLADSRKLVMLPFSTLADLFPKLVRDLSRDQGKEIELVIRGGDVEIDKRILDEMKDPLVHLLRNAIDHGIEKPGPSSRPGKPPRATIALTVTTVNGNKMDILVADDGAGIDLARVVDAAIKRGTISPEEARSLDEHRTLELIFQSEVSTSPIITEISGRGLGLAIVREKAEKLGGRVSVETRPAAGTTFRISLPLTLATFRGILVRAGGQVFVLPTAQVEHVARVKTPEIKTVENRETISLNDRAVALVRLDEVLGLPRRDGQTTADAFTTVVLLGSGDARIAFAVDEVLHDEEVLVKNLRPPLSRVRNIAGATVLASGRLVPILHAADLMKSARKAGTAPRVASGPTGAAQAPVTARAKSILLAEDSITSRLLLKGILESAGYVVKTAVDGIDAWTTLRTENFDLVLSDVEMPRMNGFDLTAHIRADARLADKPVVLVTALASPTDRERGIDVGANAYIVKSNFDQSNLLDVIRRLV